MAPRALWIEGPQLLVCDYGNSRVLIWNSLPTMNGQPADIELGQLNFTSAYNRPDRTHIGGPAGLLVKNGRLYDGNTLDEVYPRQRKMEHVPGTPEKPSVKAGVDLP